MRRLEQAGADLEIERFPPANGFSGAVAVTAHGVKTVYVARQVGGGDTLAARTTAVWGRVGQQLEAAETAGGTRVDSVTSAISRPVIGVSPGCVPSALTAPTAC